MAEPPAIDEVRARLEKSGFYKWTQSELDSYAPGVASISMDAGPEHLNAQGIVAGGVLSGLLDAATSLSLRSLLDRSQASRTIQLSVNFLKPARTGKLVVKANAVHKSRSLGYAEGQVIDSENRMIARASATFIVLPADQP